jgi:PAS domain S-box-containing protein
MIDAEVLGIIVFVIGATLLAARSTLGYEHSGEWLRLALTSMGDAILMTDRQGRVKGLNHVAEKLTGWTLKDALGRPSSEVLRLVDHDTRMPVEDPVGKVLDSGAVLRLDRNTVLVARDGSERPVDSSTAPVRGRSGRMKGTVLIFRDITERYTAEQNLLESEERLRAVTNEARIGLVMINRDRRYVYANNFYLQMIGIANANVMGKRVADVLPVLYEQIRPNLDKAFAGERLSYEVKGLNKKEQGLGRIYSVTYEPQKRQSLVMHVVIVVVDITHMRRGAEPQA